MSIRITLMMLAFCVSCHDDEQSHVLLSVEEFLPIIIQCQEETKTSPSEITALLLGEWDLRAYGCGFCIPHNPPMANVSFNENRGILTFEEDPALAGQQGTLVLDFTWELEEQDNGLGSVSIVLRTSPSHYALNGLSFFCDDYMFYDHRPVDGHLFLYEKR